jgi:hypothetical protein
MMANLQVLSQGLAVAENQRATARQIEHADNREHHRIASEQMARQTAFNYQMLQDFAARPVSLPAALTPVHVTNVITPIQNTMNNVFQTTHNLHQNTLNFFSNVNNHATKVLNLFGPNLHPGQGQELDPIMNGGPPPPPSSGSARIARDSPLAIADRPVPIPVPTTAKPPRLPGSNPLAIKDKPVKKPKPLKPRVPDIIPLPLPPSRPVPIILTEPQRKKPRKADEIMRILDGITDSEPRRVKKLIAELPMNRLRLRAA